MIQPTKIIDLALIKDMRNPTAPTIGWKKIHVVGGAPTSDMPTSDFGAYLSSTPSTSVHSQPLISTGYTLIPTSQLEEIMRILLLNDAHIKMLEVKVKPYVSDVIRATVRIVETQANRFESQITTRINTLQAPNLTNIRTYLTDLNNPIKVLAERTEVLSPPPPPMPSLGTPMVDVDLLVPDFYTPTPMVDETGMEDMRGDLEPQRGREWVVRLSKMERRNQTRKKER